MTGEARFSYGAFRLIDTTTGTILLPNPETLWDPDTSHLQRNPKEKHQVGDYDLGFVHARNGIPLKVAAEVVGLTIGEVTAIHFDQNTIEVQAETLSVDGK